MMRLPEWYRSNAPLAPEEMPRPSASRAIRNWFRARLPDPDVRDKTIVLYARRGLRKKTAWAGMFSEFHAVLGALAYAERRGAAGVRVDFRSALYVDRARGPNWWTYFFSQAEMPVRSEPPHGDVHLTKALAKYGRYGGFCDVVNGGTPYLYPMTYGGEVRRAIAAAAPPRYQVVVATDETDFLDFMRREFGDEHVLYSEDAPRARAGGPPVHFDATLGVSNYWKGKAGLIDCLLLARSDYLVKGRSNLSDASLAFNADLPYSLCLR